jgi:addiction module HigA family antidote
MTDEPKPPLHPGEILREEYMVPNELSSNALAGHLHVTTARINEIAKEQRGITADSALRIARFFGTTAEFWMDLQKQHELQTARIESSTKIEQEITPLQKAAMQPLF